MLLGSWRPCPGETVNARKSSNDGVLPALPQTGQVMLFFKCPNELSEKIIGIAHSRHFIKFQRLCPFFNFAFSSTFLSSQFLF